MPIEFHVPALGEGVYEAELVEWLVAPGQPVDHGQPLMEVMTDKAVMPIPAPFAGVVQELRAEAGQTIQVGQTVLTYESGEAKAESGDQSVETEKVGSEDGAPEVRRDENGRERSVEVGLGDGEGSPMSAARVAAAPSVRRRARQMGVDLAMVPGSGPGGRVLMGDLLRVPSDASPAARSSPSFAPGSRIALRGVRGAVAETMSRAKRTIPHYSLIDECDVTALVQLRASLKEKCAQVSVKLTYLAFMVRAAVEALQEVPLINASLDDEAEEIVLHDHYHIGIAAATPQGLLVPVIHHADKKGVLEIAREIERLSSEARAGRSRPENLRGATFTITSIGNVGGLIATPIIPPPQAAIMGAGKIVRRPIYDEHDHLRPADLLYLSFSFDHRVIDGDIGARFANAVIARLQNPAALLLK